MAAGLPVIASDLAAHRTLIEHRQTGWMVDSAAEFREALEFLDGHFLRRVQPHILANKVQHEGSSRVGPVDNGVCVADVQVLAQVARQLVRDDGRDQRAIGSAELAGHDLDRRLVREVVVEEQDVGEACRRKLDGVCNAATNVSKRQTTVPG
jgi:hypothetical protein